jgi:hypothetical protein
MKIDSQNECKNCHPCIELLTALVDFSVEDPGSGAFLTPRSGMGKK